MQTTIEARSAELVVCMNIGESTARKTVLHRKTRWKLQFFVNNVFITLEQIYFLLYKLNLLVAGMLYQDASCGFFEISGSRIRLTRP